MGDWHILPEIIAVSEAERLACCREACALGQSIFNYSALGSSDDDRLRRQLDLPDPQAPACSAVEARVRRALTAQGIAAGAAVMLYSAPGCQQQAMHTDYDTSQMALEAEHGLPTPYAVVVAIMDGTTLIVEEETVAIPTGSALRFAGDVVHAGAGYKRGHARMHFYAKTSPELDARGRTFLVAEEEIAEDARSPEVADEAKGAESVKQKRSRRAKWPTVKCRRDRYRQP